MEACFWPRPVVAHQKHGNAGLCSRSTNMRGMCLVHGPHHGWALHAVRSKWVGCSPGTGALISKGSAGFVVGACRQRCIAARRGSRRETRDAR